ncbi:YjcZ family sporulation protein [Pseudalkalibacillus caeni]
MRGVDLMSYYGGYNTFVLYVVLFILLIIIGASYVY